MLRAGSSLYVYAVLRFLIFSYILSAEIAFETDSLLLWVKCTGYSKYCGSNCVYPVVLPRPILFYRLDLGPRPP